MKLFLIEPQILFTPCWDSGEIVLNESAIIRLKKTKQQGWQTCCLFAFQETLPSTDIVAYAYFAQKIYAQVAALDSLALFPVSIDGYREYSMIMSVTDYTGTPYFVRQAIDTTAIPPGTNALKILYPTQDFTAITVVGWSANYENLAGNLNAAFMDKSEYLSWANCLAGVT